MREGTRIGRSPSRSAIRSCTSRPISPSEASVPAPPPSIATNMRGAYIAEAGALRGLRVALIDDVATTGATLAAASSALRAAGARDVRMYVVALDE